MTAFENPFASILAQSLGRKPSDHPVTGRGAQLRPVFRFRLKDSWMMDRSTTPANPGVADFTDLRFDADIEALAKQAQRELNQMEADFVWLILGVYLADRMSPRYPYGHRGTGYWRRKIHLALPMSEPTAWAQHQDALRELLFFLTEDDWSFEFLPGRAKWENIEGQTHFPDFVTGSRGWTALFSGGLDSFAGALQALQRLPGDALLISGQTCSRIATRQGEQVAALRNRLDRSIEHLGVEYGFIDKRAVIGTESSQRTRAFVHVGLGGLAALMNGSSELHLFENGFGALNLSCDPSQIGSQSSRGTHPLFLRRMGSFISTIFGRAFAVNNPFLFHTKAEMLGVPGVANHADLFATTFSCDRYPNYPHKASQCGVCPSCLVRRQSLHAAHLPDPQHLYTVDVLHDRQSWRERDTAAMVKLGVQAEALAEVLQLKDPWPSLVVRWPDLLRTERELGLSDFQERVLRLLRNHVREWQSFASDIPVLRLADAA